MYDNDTNGTTRSILQLAGGASGASDPAARPVSRLVDRSDRLRLAVRLGIGIGLGGYAAFLSPVAEAANFTAVTMCSTCVDVASLNSFANGWAQGTLPLLGTHVLVSSTKVPVSGMFKVKQTARGVIIAVWETPPGETACTDTVSCNTQANRLDNRIFARSAKFEPVHVNLPYTADTLDVQIKLAGQITWVGGNGFVDLHWLGVGFPLIWYYNLSLNGAPAEPVFLGDPIVIIFDGSPGWAMQYEFTGLGPSMPHAQPNFEPLPNTMTYQGKPVKPPSNIQATPMANWSTANAADTWPTGHITTESDISMCSGISSITIDDPAGGPSSVSTGFFVFPC